MKEILWSRPTVQCFGTKWRQHTFFLQFSETSVRTGRDIVVQSDAVVLRSQDEPRVLVSRRELLVPRNQVDAESDAAVLRAPAAAVHAADAQRFHPAAVHADSPADGRRQQQRQRRQRQRPWMVVESYLVSCPRVIRLFFFFFSSFCLCHKMANLEEFQTFVILKCVTWGYE